MTQHIVHSIKWPFPYLVQSLGSSKSSSAERDCCPSVVSFMKSKAHISQCYLVQYECMDIVHSWFPLWEIRCCAVCLYLQMQCCSCVWCLIWAAFCRGTWEATQLSMNGCIGTESCCNFRRWPVRLLLGLLTCTSTTSFTGSLFLLAPKYFRRAKHAEDAWLCSVMLTHRFNSLSTPHISS